MGRRRGSRLALAAMPRPEGNPGTWPPGPRIVVLRYASLSIGKYLTNGKIASTLLDDVADQTGTPVTMKQEPGAEDGIPKLVRCLGRVSLPTGSLGTVISRLANACRLAPLAAEAGISSSHLRARVNAEIGGPLSHLRLWSRLKTAVACLPDGPTAVTAARAGFADHPHLTRVTRCLAGRAPGEAGL